MNKNHNELCSSPLNFHSKNLKKVGRYTFLMPYNNGNSYIKIMCADGPRSTEAAERNERSFNFRSIIKENPLLNSLFPDVLHFGDCYIDERKISCLITSYKEGYDLLDIAKTKVRTDSFFDIFNDLGEAMSELHKLNVNTINTNGEQKHLYKFNDNWKKHILGWVGKLSNELLGVEQNVVVGKCSIRDVHKLIKKIEVIVKKNYTSFDSLSYPVILHNDAHGGNFIAFENEDGWKLNGIIDERLRGGDGLFDIASLISWSFEVFDHVEHKKICKILHRSYFNNKLFTVEEMHRIRIYLIERSLGRLNIYLSMSSAERESINPQSVSSLHKHIELIESIVNTNNINSLIDIYD